METKSIIFDFGNVIAQFNNQNFIVYLAPYTKKSPEELTSLIYPESTPMKKCETGLITSGLPKQYEMGLISSEEFFSGVRELTGANISQETFSEIYTQDKFWPIPETIELIRKLKERDYKIGLLSNTSEWDYELGFKPIFRRAGIEFDSNSLAFEIHAMKPDERIYRHSLETLKVLPENAVYIDDIERYAEVANNLGMKGVHFDYRKDNLAEKLGVEGVEV